MITDVIWAIGLVFMIEGLVYLLAPHSFVEMLKRLAEMPIYNLRMTGAIVALLGGLILLAVRHWA